MLITSFIAGHILIGAINYGTLHLYELCILEKSAQLQANLVQAI